MPQASKWKWLRSFLPTALVVGSMALMAWMFQAVLTPFILAVVLVYVMEPVVQRLNFHGTFGFHWPRWLAIVSVYLTLLSAVLLFGFLAVPSLAVEMTKLAGEMPAIVKNTRTRLVEATHQLEAFLDVPETVEPELDAPPTAPAPRTQRPPAFSVKPMADGSYEVQLGEVDIEAKEAGGGYVIALRPTQAGHGGGGGLRLSEAVDVRLTELLESSGARLGEAVVIARRVAEGVFGSIMGLVLTFMVAAFMSMDLNKILAYFRSLVPARYRQTGDLLLTKLDSRLSGVIRGQLIICLVNGFLTYLVLVILDMRFVVLLTALATVFTLIPIFGMIISSIPALAIAMIDGGLEKAVAVVIGVAVIHFLEANFFNPKILGSAARINPVLIIFSLLAGEHAFGLLGALLAVPFMAIFLTLLQFLVDQARGPQTEVAPARAEADRPADAA